MQLKRADRQFLENFKLALNNYLFREVSLENIEDFAATLWGV